MMAGLGKGIPLAHLQDGNTGFATGGRSWEAHAAQLQACGNHSLGVHMASWAQQGR